MDFRYSPEEEAFRAEASAWLEGALPRLPDVAPTDLAGREAVARQWQDQLHKGGWAGISWPEEYGGRGLSIVHEAIFYAEAALRGAPRPINFLGIALAGPTILIHGDEEQKQRFLPRMLSGEEIWCQGFSEPEAGSDLAGLHTRAERTPGGWTVTGQKVWTSFAHIADRCMLLARTGTETSKHAGLTYFCAPMKEVEVRPLPMLNGDRDFNELHLDGVAVPDEDVLGRLGEGWKVALTTLAFERGALSLLFWVEAQQVLDQLTDLVRALGLEGDAATLERVGGSTAQVEALRIGVLRLLSSLRPGSSPGPEGSLLKLLWARSMQDMTRFAVALQAQQGVRADEPQSGRWLHHYLRARGNSVEGGTDEIQLSIVAERLLGLPRSR